MSIILVVFDSKATKLSEQLYPKLEAYIDQNYVQAKRKEEYGNVYFDALESVDHEEPKQSSGETIDKKFDEWDFEEKHERKLEERMKYTI